MDNTPICRLCLNWTNGQYVSIDSFMIEKLEALCPDMKTTLLEGSEICSLCIDLLQKFDYLRNKYNMTKKTCKVCGVRVVDQYHVTSSDTLQMCDDLGFSVSIDSKVCDECMKTMNELNILRMTLNNTQVESHLDCDKATIKNEVELSPVELNQSHSCLLDELNACLESNTTRPETGSSCEEKNYSNKNNKQPYKPSEQQVCGSASNTSIEDNVGEPSGPSISSSEDDTEENSEKYNDELQSKTKMPQNVEDPDELGTLGTQESVDEELQSCEQSRKKGALEAHSLVHKKEPGEVSMFECHICKYKTKRKHHFKAHLLIHKKPEDVKMFECHICKYKTIQKNNLKKHLLIHMKPEEVDMFECHICKYRTIQKNNLKKHFLIHNRPENIEMFECHICKYKAIQKSSLKRHLLTHKTPEELEMFKCHFCTFKTKHKSYLNRHFLIHMKPEDVEMLECHICEYKAKTRINLKKHLLIHKKPGDIEMFECHICGNKLKRKDDLKTHLLLHKAPEDIDMFECHICKYKTIMKNNLKKHLLIHKKPEDVEMFECHICKYKSKRKCSLKRHLLIHKKPEDVKRFECHICTFKAIQRSNLKKHLLVHEKPEDIEMFECYNCKFKSKWKKDLKKHIILKCKGQS